MANINGTNVAAKIVPFTTDDSYATHDETYGVGGYRTVSSVTEMNNIPSARRKEGMLVNVTGDKIYKLVNGSFVDAGLGGGSGSEVYYVDINKLDFTYIANGDSASQEQIDEVSNCIVYWSQGMTVIYNNPNTILLDGGYAGTLNMGFNPATMTVSFILPFNQDSGPGAFLYTIDTQAEIWTVQMLGGGGGGSSIKILTTSNLFVLDRGEDISLNIADTAVLKSMFNNGYKSTQLYYVGAPLGDWGVFPISIECSSFPSSLSDGDSPWMSITYSSGLPVYEQFVYNESNDSFDSVDSTARINNQMTFYTQNSAQNGYMKFHNGTMIQWGYGTSGAAQPLTVYMPSTFYNMNYNVVASIIQDSTDANLYVACPIVINSTSYFRLDRKFLQPAGGAGYSSAKFTWIAIGRWK